MMIIAHLAEVTETWSVAMDALDHSTSDALTRLLLKVHFPMSGSATHVSLQGFPEVRKRRTVPSVPSLQTLRERIRVRFIFPN